MDVIWTIRGVPSSSNRGDVVRNRRGIERYIPPCVGSEEVRDDESIVFATTVFVDGACVLPLHQSILLLCDIDTSSSTSAEDGIDSATIGTPNMEARIALTT